MSRLTTAQTAQCQTTTDPLRLKWIAVTNRPAAHRRVVHPLPPFVSSSQRLQTITQTCHQRSSAPHFLLDPAPKSQARTSESNKPATFETTSQSPFRQTKSCPGEKSSERCEMVTTARSECVIYSFSGIFSWAAATEKSANTAEKTSNLYLRNDMLSVNGSHWRA